jgi:hypothetical protein
MKRQASSQSPSLSLAAASSNNNYSPYADPGIQANDAEILKTASGKKWAAALKQGAQAGYEAFVEMTAEFASGKPSIPRDALARPRADPRLGAREYA